jgi:hypothetical protein
MIYWFKRHLWPIRFRFLRRLGLLYIIGVGLMSSSTISSVGVTSDLI